METQYRINYKSDFSFLLVLKDCDGQEIGWPACDWQAKFFTPGNKANAYFASSKGGALTNCYNDGGFIHVVCDNHHLGIGCLNVEFTMLQPNDDFPDGNERKSFSAQLNIELVRENATCEIIKEIKAEVLLSMIHDTDVYAEVLDRVNGVLAGLLDGSGEAGKPTKQQSNFRISQWLTPGMMRNTARPGMVYDASTGAERTLIDNDVVNPFNGSSTGVMLLSTSQREGTIDLSKLFPGGKSGENDIIVAPRIYGRLNLQWDYDPIANTVSYKWDRMSPGASSKFALMVIFYLAGYTKQVYIDEEGRLRMNPEPVCFRPAPEWKGDIRFLKPTDEEYADFLAHRGDNNSYRPHRMARLYAPDGRRIEVKYLHNKGFQAMASPKKSCYWLHPHGWSFIGKHFLRVRVVTKRGLRTPWHICQKVGPGTYGNNVFKVVQ